MGCLFNRSCNSRHITVILTVILACIFLYSFSKHSLNSLITHDYSPIMSPVFLSSFYSGDKNYWNPLSFIIEHQHYELFVKNLNIICDPSNSFVVEAIRVSFWFWTDRQVLSPILKTFEFILPRT